MMADAFTDAMAVTQLLAPVLALYVALGIMATGFGFMVSGKNGGKCAAHFYFARSLSWSIEHVRALFTTVFATLWGVLLSIARPLTHYLWHAMRWVVTRQRGWVQGRNVMSSASHQARSWPTRTQLVATVKEFATRYFSLQSLPFLLCLFCAVVGIFIICFFLLRSLWRLT